MKDKELIRQEIERRIDLYSIAEKENSTFACMGALSSIIDYIDSIPKESGCEVNCTTKSEDLKEEIERWIKKKHFIFTEIDEIIETASHFAEWQKQKDFEELLKSDMSKFNEYYEKGRFDMREEMMKDAVEGQIYREYIGDDGISIAFGLEAYLNEHNPKHNKLHDGDKVKIVIVKEEQQ